MADVSGPSAKAKGNRFFALPASAVGRGTGYLSLVALASVLVMSIIGEPAQPTWRGAFGIFVVTTVIATAVGGFLGMTIRHERSWAVVIPTLVCLSIVVNEVIQWASFLM